MSTKKKVKQRSSYTIDNTELEQVNSFKYLGSAVNNGNIVEEETKESTATGNKAFYTKRELLVNY